MIRLLVIATLALFATTYVVQYVLKRKVPQKPAKAKKELFSSEITPMPADFDWTTHEPERYRPMKNGEYKMTMGLKSLTFDEYILFDKNYLDRTNIRIKIAEELPQETMLYNEVAEESVKEYYDFIIDFFVRRYPMIFQVTSDKQVYNSARKEYLPLNSKNQEAPHLLQLLARHMEDDFLILQKKTPDGEYILRAGTAIFPNGFSPAENFNKELSQIHQPVPQYNSKLKLAMNKFFDRVRPYQFVYRVNWGIQIHTNLFALTGNHGRPQEFKEVERLDATKVDFNKIFLRSERQVLTRLPKTGATVLSLKTYATPLTKIRDEGLSDTLIGAIDGIPEDIAIYKNRPKWGEAVKSYMRGDTNGITDLKYDYEFTT